LAVGESALTSAEKMVARQIEEARKIKSQEGGHALKQIDVPIIQKEAAKKH
jgi:hypothetical protein